MPNKPAGAYGDSWSDTGKNSSRSPSASRIPDAFVNGSFVLETEGGNARFKLYHKAGESNVYYENYLEFRSNCQSSCFP